MKLFNMGSFLSLSFGYEEHDVLASLNLTKEESVLVKHNNHFLLRVDRGSLN